MRATDWPPNAQTPICTAQCRVYRHGHGRLCAADGGGVAPVADRTDEADVPDQPAAACEADVQDHPAGASGKKKLPRMMPIACYPANHAGRQVTSEVI